MITVTVDYVIKKAHAAQFREAVQAQARNSLTREPDCRQFDVSVDPSDPGRFFQ
jgi:quinol monooxygenase YgiN